MNLFLEIAAVVTGLAFLVLLILEIRWCWLFGIISSALFVILMYQVKLYSESLLYVFYIFIGFYGWYQWNRKTGRVIAIKTVSWIRLLMISIAAILGSIGVGLTFEHYTDAERPFADAASSVLSIVASFMEAHKWLAAWIYWIIINGFSIWLYFDRSLNLASVLMLIYFILSVWGYFQWEKKLITLQKMS